MNIPNYDNWLVAPMERMEAEAARFEAFCDQYNLEYDDPDAERLFEDFVADRYEEPDDSDYDDPFDIEDRFDEFGWDY